MLKPKVEQYDRSPFNAQEKPSLFSFKQQKKTDKFGDC
jgi:hypothetical protein